MEEVVKFNQLGKKFKQQVIFNEISLSFNGGQIIGITGQNGSGKSVLFKLMAGLERPSTGEIMINGHNITKTNSFPDNMGILIENPPFIDNLTGFENLKLLAAITNQINNEQIKVTLKQVGLDDARYKKVKYYSLGMKKKLGIAQAIMEHQKIILLDEPMNALDEESVLLMRILFKKLAEQGKTIFIASHNKEDIQQLCHTVYRVKNNQLIKQKKAYD
ncbi:ATP-binding cassette domain-containing protein [Holzapfeliella sp. He02]|uniref:ATP-binding cassette domain-containing protein n=1 Tax=Holzapfeliella saturejae TaxID=3082953 RepID=A0ABU8SHV3_9LACO